MHLSSHLSFSNMYLLRAALQRYPSCTQEVLLQFRTWLLSTCLRLYCSCSSMSTRSKVHVAYLRSTVGYMRKHAQCIEVEVEEGCSLEVLHASLVRLCASENSRTCTNIVLHGESRVSPATPRNQNNSTTIVQRKSRADVIYSVFLFKTCWHD